MVGPGPALLGSGLRRNDGVVDVVPHRHSGPRAGIQGPGTWIPTSSGMTTWGGAAVYFHKGI